MGDALKQDEERFRADKLAREAVESHPPPAVLELRDNLKEWTRRMSYYVADLGVQSEVVKYAVYRRCIGADVQERLQQFAEIDSTKVKELLDKRSVTEFLLALQIITARESTLVSTVLEVVQSLQVKGPLLEAPAKVERGLNLIADAIKSFQAPEAAKELFQLAVSPEIYREFAKLK